MGRLKKEMHVNLEVIPLLSQEDKLVILNLSQQVYTFELSKIDQYELVTVDTGKAEVIAKKFYEQEGFEVFNSKTVGGYRSIGVEYYWPQYKEKQSQEDKDLTIKLRSMLQEEEFRSLAFAVKEKNGTPDLLLIKDGKIRFVEVKFNYETVKMDTIKFFILYGSKWNISILRVRKE